MENTPITIQQGVQAASPTQPAQLLRFRHSCENCRRRKIKCSGTRPICEHCLRRGIECIYKPLARSTRRSTSALSSPAMSVSSHGVPRQPRVRPGQPQPISIPLSSGVQYTMPLHLMQGARYSSAPANPESPYLQAAYQAQFKRPATAIPPHLCIGGSSLSPLGSPQLAYMYGSLPTEMGSSLGSYNSIQSEGTEFASPGNDPMNLVTMSNPLYDVQIPGSPAAQQQAAMAFAGGKNPGMAPSVGLGLPSQLHVPGRQDGGVEAGRAQTMGAATHRRTMTDESSDSISNIPLIERSVFGGSYETDGGYTDSAMSVNYNQQQQYHFSLPSDFGALGNSAESGGSALACNSQEYMDLIASYGLSHDPNTVAPAANYHMLMDSKLGGWEPHHPQLQQQPQQREQPASGLMSGIAPELTVNPPPPSQHQEPP